MTEHVTRSITCDCCGTELIVDSSMPAKYSLELKYVNTGINTSRTVYAVDVQPPFRHHKHFCDCECLGNWLESK